MEQNQPLGMRFRQRTAQGDTLVQRHKIDHWVNTMNAILFTLSQQLDRGLVIPVLATDTWDLSPNPPASTYKTRSGASVVAIPGLWRQRWGCLGLTDS